MKQIQQEQCRTAETLKVRWTALGSVRDSHKIRPSMLNCVCSAVYPMNCTKYYGPHSLSCLVTMWTAATCLPAGYKFPGKLTTDRLSEFDTWNIRFVLCLSSV